MTDSPKTYVSRGITIRADLTINTNLSFAVNVNTRENNVTISTSNFANFHMITMPLSAFSTFIDFLRDVEQEIGK